MENDDFCNLDYEKLSEKKQLLSKGIVNDSFLQESIQNSYVKSTFMENKRFISNVNRSFDNKCVQISGKDFNDITFDEYDYLTTNNLKVEGFISFISVSPELIVLVIKNENSSKNGKLLSLQITVSGEIGPIRTLHSGNIICCSSSFCGTYIMVITINQEDLGQIHYLKPPYSLQTVGYNIYDVRSVVCLPDNTILVIGKMDYDDWSLMCWTSKCKRLKWKEILPKECQSKTVKFR